MLVYGLSMALYYKVKGILCAIMQSGMPGVVCSVAIKIKHLTNILLLEYHMAISP